MSVREQFRSARRALDFSWLGLLGLLVLFDDWFPGLRWFALFFLVYPLQWAKSLVRLVRWNRLRPRTVPPITLGQVLGFYASLGLSLFNPWILGQSLLMTAGQLAAGLRMALGRGTGRSGDEVLDCAPPFAGTWTVARGGTDPETSHAWGVPNQRYAYDFIVTDEEGRSHVGGGKRLEDYYAFGQEILAPADGVVVAVCDGQRDFPCPGTGLVDPFARDVRGNFVVIRHGPRAYGVLAHLQRGRAAGTHPPSGCVT